MFSNTEIKETIALPETVYLGRGIVMNIIQYYEEWDFLEFIPGGTTNMHKVIPNSLYFKSLADLTKFLTELNDKEDLLPSDYRGSSIFTEKWTYPIC